MRRFATICFLFVLIGAPIAAQDAGPLPWEPIVPGVEAGARGIAIGFWADVVGLGLIAGAGPAYSLGFDVGNGFFGLGLSSMLFVGAPVLQRGMDQHHEALLAMGYDVSEENRARSRRFTRISVGCGIASFTLGMTAIATDTFAPAIVSLLVGATGAGFEIWNFYGHRQAWAAHMREAAGVE
jgi:hypothetical protein